jgi:hypothetical protein
MHDFPSQRGQIKNLEGFNVAFGCNTGKFQESIKIETQWNFAYPHISFPPKVPIASCIS